MTGPPRSPDAALRSAALARARATNAASARLRSELASNAANRREALLACLRLGMTQRELARHLGCSTRVIRKALEREDLWQ